MKKILSLGLLVLLCVTVFVGCESSTARAQRELKESEDRLTERFSEFGEKVQKFRSETESAHSILDDNIHPKGGTFSLRQYEKLEDDMSFEQVIDILNANYDEDADLNGYTDYSSHQEKYDSIALIFLSFHNGKLYNKFQSGLE